ncbi:MAG: bifunctional riboflavin kinase/FAD synthetase [Gammaproteobacteria bacterium]|nr:bifunctional riboflavin kinase/FAD synthetase [Gammaproteobacteria bacterium]MDH5595033.1 bifunctional riboflavin kinase/FAD synthetase [Gammaproteobacteria bacterium]
MELIRGLQNLKPEHSGCVATIGNFDGVHLGHQAVLGQLSEKAAEMGLPSLVITFEPQPQEFFTPESSPARLTRFREKLRSLLRFSIDRVLVLRFDQKLASLSADEFIKQVLIKGLGIRYLVVGDDFRFGKMRQGNFAMLQSAGAEYGFQVVNMHTFNIDGERVSSTRIRKALVSGDLNTAEKLLGRPYRMCGRVAHGDKRGRSIGFPTANIHLHRNATPVQGVYCVEMFGLDVEPVEGVANVGTRPTVDGTRSLLEVHLFNFGNDIYGRYVHVDFVKKLRDELRFDSFDELKNQIEKDVINAHDYFNKRDKVT